MLKKILISGVLVVAGLGGANAQVTSKGYTDTTFVKKTDLSVTGDTGNGYVKSVTQSNGTFTVTKENIKIPSGNANADPTVSIWVSNAE